MRRRARQGSAAGRLGVITVDQAIAGGSNVLIAVLAARLLDVTSFGFFGLVFLLYVLVQSVSRALICDPVLVHPDEAQERLGDVLGSSILLGAGLAAVTLLIGAASELWDDRLASAVLALAVCVPLLVLQDLGRYLAFAFGRPVGAVVLDGLWLVLQCATVAVLVVTDTRSLGWLVAAWAGSGALAGMLVPLHPSVGAIRLKLTWLRRTWGFSWRYLVSYASTQGAALAGSSGIGAIAGARALAGVQGATLLVRPYVTFQVAAIAATVGEVQRASDTPSAVRSRVLKVSVVTIGAAVVNGGALLALPDALGRAVLGDTWSVAEPLLLPTAVQLLFLGAATGVRGGMLGLKAIDRVMKIDIGTTIVVLAAGVVGAALGGALGALWTIAAVQAAVAFVWWGLFVSLTADGAPPAAPAAHLDPQPL